MEETTEPLNQPQFPVTVWEAIALTIGAVLIMAIGTVGLIYKFFSNAADPQRATLIARSLIDYKIPEGAQGMFGANLGGAKVAIITSPSFPRDPSTLTPEAVEKLSGVELFVARVPLDVETTTDTTTAATEPDKAAETYDLFSSPDYTFAYRAGEDFQVQSERIENRTFCKVTVPVRIQEGELLLSDQLPTVPAVKYDAIATFDDSKRQVTLTAIGKNAETTAKQVFDSLKCK